MSNTGIHIGNIVDKVAQERLLATITGILDSGFKNHTTDPVMLEALRVVKDAYAVTGVTVTNSVFTTQDGPLAKKAN